MPQVGRPRSRTGQGTSVPTSQIGSPWGLFGTAYGTGGIVGSQNPLTGSNSPWRMYVDEWEQVPELRWPWNVWTYEQMRRDSQLAGLLTAVMWGICQLRYVVDPNGCPDSMVEEISQDLNLPILGKDGDPRRRMKGRFAHASHILQAMLSPVYGNMWFEQQGKIINDKFRLTKLIPYLPHTIRQINVADDGGLVSIQQWASKNPLSFMGMGPEIPVDRLTAFVFQKEGASWSGRSMLHDVYKDWLIKDRDVRIEMVNHERAGGVPYATAPQGATPADIQNLDQMMRQFRIGDNSGGALPFGSELHIAKGTGSDVDRTIRRIDEAMARRFLLMLANLAQGGQHVGSYALGETFEDFFLVGQRHIAQWYCDVMTEHVIEDIIDWNYGEDTELTPRLTWERTSEDSLGVEQLALLVQRGVIVMDEELENTVRYKFLLPKRTTPRPDPEEVSEGGPRQHPGNMQKGTAEPATQAAGVPPGTLPPSAETPAAVQASFWQRLTGRKPDVMAAAPSIVTVPNVEILHAGVEYSLMRGSRTFTPEDLQDAVMAANEDNSIPSPRLKIGHVDPRYNDLTIYDGSPAFGKATNLRLSENGMAVYADFVGVPRWLADIMPYAFPSRSIEGYDNVESQMGKRWRFVLSACSLLGVQWPGITVLEDLPQYYGDEIPEGVIIDPAIGEAVAASNQPGGGPMRWGRKTAASANLDDIRRAFYQDYVPANRDASWWWIQAVLTDPNELVVEDDETGQLFKLSFGSDASGAVSFGEPQPVRIDYVPDNREALMAAAPHVAATLAIGRNVLASWSSRADSSPDYNTGGTMDPKEVRRRLSLPETATDEQVRETIAALNASMETVVEPTQPGAIPPEQQPTPPPAPAPTPTPPPGAPEPPAQPGTEPPPPGTATPEQIAASLPAGTVLVDENTWEQTRAGLARTTSFIEKQEEEARKGLVAAAIADGRIPGASKDHWLNMLENDPNGAATLATLAKGLVPVNGNVGNPNTGVDPALLEEDTISQWSADLFPEVRAQRARDAAVAAGHQVPRQRVVADGHYTRR